MLQLRQIITLALLSLAVLSGVNVGWIGWKLDSASSGRDSQVQSNFDYHEILAHKMRGMESRVMKRMRLMESQMDNMGSKLSSDPGEPPQLVGGGAGSMKKARRVPWKKVEDPESEQKPRAVLLNEDPLSRGRDGLGIGVEAAQPESDNRRKAPPNKNSNEKLNENPIEKLNEKPNEKLNRKSDHETSGKSGGKSNKKPSEKSRKNSNKNSNETSNKKSSEKSNKRSRENSNENFDTKSNARPDSKANDESQLVPQANADNFNGDTRDGRNQNDPHNSKEKSSSSSQKHKSRADASRSLVWFDNFREPEIGWYARIYKRKINVAVSFYINELNITPGFYEPIVSIVPRPVKFHEDSDTENSTTSHKEIEDCDFFTIDDSTNTFSFNVRNYIQYKMALHSFVISFGPDFETVDLNFRFDKLDYVFDQRDWDEIETATEDLPKYMNPFINGCKKAPTFQKHKKYNVETALRSRKWVNAFHVPFKVLQAIWPETSIVDIYSYTHNHVRPPQEELEECNERVLMEKMDGDGWQFFLDLHHKFRNRMWEEPQELQYRNDTIYYAMLEREISELTNSMVQAIRVFNKHGYVYMDMRSGNMLYRNKENGEHEWKLTDFESVGLIKWGNKGNFAYSPPRSIQVEVLRHENAKIPAELEKDAHIGDIYGLGGIIYECLNGKFAWQWDEFDQFRKTASQQDIRVAYLGKINKYKDFENCDYCVKRLAHVSDELKDFLYKVMKFSAKKRLTWEEAQEHPFLQQEFRDKQNRILGLI